MRISSNATKQMEAVINKIDTFPNRIASAQQSSLMRTASNISRNMYRKYPASRFLDYEISQSGNLGYKLTITPDKNMKTSTGAEAFIAVAVFLKGRKAYRVTSRSNVDSLNRGRMVLRKESVPPYPRFLLTADIPAMKGREYEFRQEVKEDIIKNIRYALGRFGFGPRGGASGLSDMPSVRSRAR